MGNIVKILSDKNLFLSVLLSKFSFLFTDKLYLYLRWRLKMKTKLNLNDPQSFNEKMQWLKLYDRKPIYKILADKVKVKEYVSKVIGEEHIIPTIGVWDSVNEIDFDKLPNKFVIKCNHDSGGLFICRNKKDISKMQWNDVLSKLKKRLKHDYYKDSREWCYKNIQRKIIAEQLLEGNDGNDIYDYKIFCFNGEPHFIEVDYDRFTDHKLNVYDTEWNFIDFYMTSRNDKNKIINRPQKLDIMLDYARTISKDFYFARVDFYNVNNNIYFGEITFYPGAGMIDFHPKDYDLILGKLLKLPQK